MQLSVVIAAWSATPELTQMAIDLCHQVRPFCDELIVSEDGPFQREIWEVVDKYLVHSRVGHLKNNYIGIQAAKGDFIASMDSDLIIHSGNLRDLCIPGQIVCPKWRENREYTGMVSWFVVAPRDFFLEKYPLPIEASEEVVVSGWIRDYYPKVKDVYTWSNKVEYSHLGNRSYDALMRQKQEQTLREAALRKEIDPQRHKARMIEDSVYAERFSNASESSSGN